MASTPLSIVNRALLQMGGGDVAQITSADWASPVSAAAVAGAALYSPAVQALLREVRPAFANAQATLSASGNVAPFGWTQEYVYPAGAVAILSVVPAARTLDPAPVRWRVGTVAVSGTQTRVIWTGLASAWCLFTSGLVLGVLPTDTSVEFDSVFEESLVRNLAGDFSEALAGRFDQARQKYGQAMDLAQIADLRADA